MKLILYSIFIMLALSCVPVRAQSRDRDFLHALNALSEIEVRFADQQLDLESSRAAREELKKDVVNKIPLEMCGLFANLLRELYLQADEKSFPVYELAHSCLTERLLGEKKESVRRILPSFNMANLDGSWGLRVGDIRRYAGEDNR